MSGAVGAPWPHPRGASDDRLDVSPHTEAEDRRAVDGTPERISPRSPAGQECGPVAPATIDVLLAREHARHTAELSVTEARLRRSAGRAPAPIVEQLRADLTRTGAAVITALEHLAPDSEGGRNDQEIDAAVERTASALRTAAAALHSALTCHLAIEALVHAPRAQVR